MKKSTGDIIILHKCTKNHHQVMYGSWNMVCDRQTDRHGQTEKVTYRGGCTTTIYLPKPPSADLTIKSDLVLTNPIGKDGVWSWST